MSVYTRRTGILFHSICEPIWNLCVYIFLYTFNITRVEILRYSADYPKQIGSYNTTRMNNRKKKKSYRTNEPSLFYRQYWMGQVLFVLSTATIAIYYYLYVFIGVDAIIFFCGGPRSVLQRRFRNKNNLYAIYYRLSSNF